MVGLRTCYNCGTCRVVFVFCVSLVCDQNKRVMSVCLYIKKVSKQSCETLWPSVQLTWFDDSNNFSVAEFFFAYAVL